MNLPVCSPAFRRQRLLVAKQLLPIAVAPAKAGTTCHDVGFMGREWETGSLDCSRDAVRNQVCSKTLVKF